MTHTHTNTEDNQLQTSIFPTGTYAFLYMHLSQMYFLSCYMTISNILWEQMVLAATLPPPHSIHTFCSSQTMFLKLCSNPSEDSVTFTQLFCHFLCHVLLQLYHTHTILFGPHFQLLAHFFMGAKSLICNFTPFINPF